jgi:PPOX class probable F420-dependent enzyme
VDDALREFLEKNHLAVMTTVKKDGTPHVAVIGVGLVDGRLWSSATQTRLRTKHLRRDNRSTLCVLNSDNRYSWAGIEARVDILEGTDAVDQNQALYEVLTGGPPENLEEYRQAMVDEQRIIFQFDIQRSYGQY